MFSFLAIILDVHFVRVSSMSKKGGFQLNCMLKPFVASQVNNKTMQDFSLKIMNTEICVTRFANTDMQLNPLMACFE